MGKTATNGVNQSNGIGGRQDTPQPGNSMSANSLALRIDTGPIHQQQPLNNAADTGPPTTQDSLSLGQLKKLVSEGVKAKVCSVTAIAESYYLV